MSAYTAAKLLSARWHQGRDVHEMREERQLGRAIQRLRSGEHEAWLMGDNGAGQSAGITRQGMLSLASV